MRFFPDSDGPFSKNFPSQKSPFSLNLHQSRRAGCMAQNNISLYAPL